MKKILFSGFRAVLLTAVTLVAASTALAQGVEHPPADPAPGTVTTGEDWSYRPATERERTPTIAQQKAMARGAQRMARLEAMRWYGFSNSRPTATAIAWTTMYSPGWQQPGGRPFAWHTSSRPIVVITQPTATPVYR